MGPSYCVAVGYAGASASTAYPLVEEWNGSSWSIALGSSSLNPPGGQSAQLDGVSCPSTAFCMAVGSWEGAGLVPMAYALSMGGTGWTLSDPQGLGASQTLDGVSCISSVECTAVGSWSGTPGGPLAEQFGQGGWSVTLDSFVDPSTGWNGGQLNSVSCVGPSACMAVGFYFGSPSDGAYAQWWNGVAWAPIYVQGLSTTQFSSFSSVSCNVAIGCSAAGQFGTNRFIQNLVANWSGGSTFLPAVTPSPTAGQSNQGSAISCVTSVACTVVGTNNPGKSQTTMILVGPVLPLGMRLTASDGGVFSLGDGLFFGSLPGIGVPASDIVGIVPTSDDLGYWMVGSDGGVFAFGDARFFGSLPGMNVRAPNIVGLIGTPDMGGYWLAASDGGVFTFGDAHFYGSAGGLKLSKPIVGVIPTSDREGYWLVAADGGVFAFGDARFYGSAGNLTLDAPIVGGAATPDGGGYWLVASDGGVFTFGDAQFYGSASGMKLAAPVVGILPTPDGLGYWLIAGDGGTFNYGDAPFVGSLGNLTLSQPIVSGANP